MDAFSEHIPPRAPDQSRLRLFTALMVNTKGIKMENNHLHGDTGCSVPMINHIEQQYENSMCN